MVVGGWTCFFLHTEEETFEEEEVNWTLDMIDAWNTDIKNIGVD